MKNLFSFFLTLAVLFSSHGVVYQASESQPVEGWNCGMELCLCSHEGESETLSNVYDGFYASSEETQTIALSSSEQKNVNQLEFTKKIKSTNLLESFLTKKEAKNAFFSETKIQVNPPYSETIKPPQS